MTLRLLQGGRQTSPPRGGLHEVVPMDGAHRDNFAPWPDRLATAAMLHGVAATLADGECVARIGSLDGDEGEPGAAWRMALRALHIPRTAEAFRRYLDETLDFCPETAEVFADLVRAMGQLDQGKRESAFGVELLGALMDDVEFRAALDPLSPHTRAAILRTALGRAREDVFRFVDMVLAIASFCRAAGELPRELAGPPSSKGTCP